MTPFVASVVPSTAITDLINAIILLVAFFVLRYFLPRGNTGRHSWLRFVLNITIMETAHSFFILGANTISGRLQPGSGTKHDKKR